MRKYINAKLKIVIIKVIGFILLLGLFLFIFLKRINNIFRNINAVKSENI